MMKSWFILSLASAFVLSSCATSSTSTTDAVCATCVAPETHELQNEFNVKPAAKALEKGRNTIKGEAFMRKNNGDIVTCAGLEALLVPETAYSQERMSVIYGNTEKGYNSETRCIKFIPDNCQYYATQGKSVCSSTGHFEFKNVKDGTYFVVALVPWEDSEKTKRGGAFMEKVSVKGGIVKEIILTNNF